MAKVIHRFVDSSGRTHVDEFKSALPLDMFGEPEVYDVFLFTRNNAALIAEQFRLAEESNDRNQVYLCCPAPGLFAYTDFAAAKTVVRQFIFENPNPVFGGLRPMRMNDYVNARVVALQGDINSRIRDATKAKGQEGDLKAAKEAADEIFKEVNTETLTATVAAHSLWKKVSWIEHFKPPLFFHMVGELVDPTWYVDENNPARSWRFKRRLGLYSDSGEATGALITLMATFRATITTVDKLTEEELKKPKHYFTRYAFRWMQSLLAQGMSPEDAMNRASWYYLQRLSNFLWLNWMSSTHRGFEAFDYDRFFSDDKDVAMTAYDAACS